MYGRGGGTCFYIKHGLSYTCSNDPLSTKDVEIQSISLTGIRENQQQLKEIEVVLIYRPPKGYELRGRELIIDFVKKIRNIDKKRELVLMGDLNWNLGDKSKPGFTHIHEIAGEFSLTQYFVSPTRITANCESTLDLIMSHAHNISYAGIVNSMISDHCRVYFVKKCMGPKKKIKRVYNRSMNNYCTESVIDSNLKTSVRFLKRKM